MMAPPRGLPRGGNREGITLEKNWLQRFARSDTDKWLGGVCGGLGEHTEVPAWFWRLIFALVILMSFGVGIVLYLLLWIFAPGPVKKEDPGGPAAG